MTCGGAGRGWDVRRFSELASTNDWLLAQARAGAGARTVAVADHQSAGKGRLGRRWEAPPGRSLLVSVLLRPVAPPGALFAVTAALALAAVEGCAAVAGVEPGIKWPNDLLIGEEKVAGILAESDPAAPGGRPGSTAVVAGLGCNLDWGDLPGATCLAAHAGRPVDRDALLDALLDALAPRVAMLDSEDGRRRTLGELRARCVTLGRRVQLATAGAGTLTGTATAIDADGRLVVTTRAGDVGVAAGDVVHLRPLLEPPR